MRLRPARRDEAEAVLAIVLARDVADIGRPDFTLQDLLGEWEMPERDFARDVFVVEDGDGRLAGYADVEAGGARVSVHPEHEGRGAGTLLRRACEARLRELGHPLRQVLVSANRGAVAHVRAAGYERIQVYRRLRVELDRLPEAAGAAVRRFDLAAEGATVHGLVERAFGEIAFNTPLSLARWHAETAPKSEPAFRLALDDADGLVGVAVGERWEDGVGFVTQLAVASRARGRGHGRALLLALLHAFRAAGLTSAELSVAGTNAPAIGLYESVGMQLDFTAERWELAEPRP